MTRRAFFGLPFVIPESRMTDYAISSGVLTAADHELADGYFGIGQATVVMVKPDTPGWLRLKELRDRPVSLLVRVE